MSRKVPMTLNLDEHTYRRLLSLPDGTMSAFARCALARALDARDATDATDSRAQAAQHALTAHLLEPDCPFGDSCSHARRGDR